MPDGIVQHIGARMRGKRVSDQDSGGKPWFRMYAEWSTDPKVQIMPEAMQRRLAMLFCFRCSDVLKTWSDAELAFQLRISAEELAATKALFQEKEFIDEHWNLLNWNKRQFVSDSSTDRTRKYRERKRTSRERHGDGGEHGSDAEVTAPDTDTDTESDTENTPKPPGTAPSHSENSEPVAASAQLCAVPPKGSQPAYTLDELYVEFVATGREFWTDTIEADWQEGYRKWGLLAIDQRITAITNLKNKLATEGKGAGRYVSKGSTPQTYLANGQWERPARLPEEQVFRKTVASVPSTPLSKFRD